MKVKHGGSNVVASSGVKSQGKFQIQASAHAFRILSSGLYSDKISAVLREIGCNAADSHIAAGCPDRPIEVKLPSTFDKDFYIKDYGIGLTHEEITGLFTTYFSSNKSDTDDMTGAFGLGSKSPFSYTDSFAVTTAKDGVQRAYTAHIGADGAPVISLLEERAATEEWRSGMMVSFPVKPSDVQEFHSKAAKVFSRFSVKPVILGGPPIREIETIVKGENFFFPVDGEYDASVVMGNVAYPINAERLGITWQDTAESALLRGNVQLLLPIGLAMPTASREELEYDPQTRTNIRQRLKEAAQELAQLLYAKTKQPYASEWEKHVSIRKYAEGLPSSVLSSFAQIINLLKIDDTEKRAAVALYCLSVCEVPSWIGGGALPSGLADTKSSAPIPATASEKCEVWKVEMTQRRGSPRAERRAIVFGRVRRGQSDEKAAVPYDKRVEVVYADSTRAYQRVRKYLEDGCCDVVLLVERASKETNKTSVKTYAKAVAEAMGGLGLKGSSTLELPLVTKAKVAKPSERKAAYAQLYATQEVSYIPVDDKMRYDVDNKLKVSAVPKEGMFYAVSGTVGRRYRRTKFTAELNGDKLKKALDPDDLMRAVMAYHEMCKRGMPFEEIKGFVVLNPGELNKLKLKDAGYKPLIGTMVEQISSENALKEFGQRLNMMPKVERDYWAAKSGGLLIALLTTKASNKDFWNYLKPKLKAFPVLYGLITKLDAANDVNGSEAGIRVLLDAFLARIPLNLAGLPKQVSLEELKKMLDEAYPLLKYFKHEDLFQVHADGFEMAYKALKLMLRSKEEISDIIDEDQVSRASAA